MDKSRVRRYFRFAHILMSVAFGVVCGVLHDGGTLLHAYPKRMAVRIEVGVQWAILACVVLWPVMGLIRWIVNAYIRPTEIESLPTCRVCGYILVGLTSGVCPECGKRIACDLCDPTAHPDGTPRQERDDI